MIASKLEDRYDPGLTIRGNSLCLLSCWMVEWARVLALAEVLGPL